MSLPICLVQTVDAHQVAEDFGVAPKQQRFWVWKRRHNSTVRPDSCLPLGMPLDTVLDLRDFKDSPYATMERNALMTVKLYLQLPELPSRPLCEIPSDSVLLFFKFYDPVKRQLTYIGHLCVHKCEPFQSTFARVAKMVGLEGPDVVGYEEIKFEPSVLCEEVPEDSTPEQVRLQHPCSTVTHMAAFHISCVDSP